MNDNVIIKCNCDHSVGIYNKDFLVRRTWEKRGAARMIDFDTMQHLLYEPGVRQLFEDGVLIIEDLEMKKRLGLEPEDATEPVNIIVLNEKQQENLLKNKPLFDFKQAVDKMTFGQIEELADFAISREISIDFDKNDYIQKRIGRNIMKSIENMRAAKED